MHRDALALRRGIDRESLPKLNSHELEAWAIVMMQTGTPIETKLNLVRASGLPLAVSQFLRKHSASPLAILVVSIALRHASGLVSDQTWRRLLDRLAPARGPSTIRLSGSLSPS